MADSHQAINSNPSSSIEGAPLLSVVVCTFNRAPLLEGCLTELLRQAYAIPTGRVEILVVNNNSSDDTEEVCARHVWGKPGIRYVFEKNQGLSQARNRGARECTGIYIAYLDDDAIPGPQYLRHVIDVLAKDAPDIAGGPIFPFYTSPKPFWFQDALEVRQHAFGTGFFDCPVSGGNFIIRRDLLLGLGMFSTEFGMLGGKLRLGEERDLIERYRATTAPTDRRIYYSQNCFVFHHVPQEKMKIAYLARRAFESGRVKTVIKRDRQAMQIATKARTSSPAALFRKLIFGSRGVYLPIRFIYHTAMIAGTVTAIIDEWLIDGMKARRNRS